MIPMKLRTIILASLLLVASVAGGARSGLASAGSQRTAAAPRMLAPISLALDSNPLPASSGTGLGVVAGRFTLDGNVDLAGTTSTGVVVWSGMGNGVFQSPVSYGGSGSNPEGLATGDFNGDGRGDLAVADEGGCTISNVAHDGCVSVVLAAGNGGFQTAALYATSSNPAFLVTGRLRGPTAPLDLIAVDYVCTISNVDHDGCVSVLLGNGNGTFQPAVHYAFGGLTDRAGSGTAATLADFNGDGRLDLAVTSQHSCGSALPNGCVSVLLGDGAGGFGAPTQYDVGPNPVGIASGDLNGDGSPDLIVVGPCEPVDGVHFCASVLLNSGKGTFGAASSVMLCACILSGIALADFNGDGALDLVASGDAGYVSPVVAAGNGDGTFGGAVTFGLNVSHFPQIAIADFNADGWPDVALPVAGAMPVFLDFPLTSPVVNGVSPVSGPVAGGTLVTIRGAGFSTAPDGTTVTFDYTPAQIARVVVTGGRPQLATSQSSVACASATTCYAISPAAPGDASGTVDVQVTTQGGTSLPTNADHFTYSPRADPGTSQVSVYPARLPVGQLAATLTVLLFGRDGNPLSGRTVTLAQGATNRSSIQPASAVSDDNGEAVFAAADSTAESVTYTATDMTDNVRITQTAMVTFEPQGDVNLDGAVTAVDALCVLREVAGLAATASCQNAAVNVAAADVNQDGSVTAVDALCTLRAVAGLSETCNQ